jgi:predicted MFS family arabinose efflux permease
MRNTHSTSTSHLSGFIMCLIGILAIAFSITLRVEPGNLINSLLSQLHTNPDVLNDLTVHYQYSLIAALLLAGIVVDLAGPRITLVGALAVAIFGNYVFANANSTENVYYSRILIGYAHPFILISVLTLGTLSLHRRHFAFFVGLVFATLLLFPTIISPHLAKITTVAELRTVTMVMNVSMLVLMMLVLLSYRIKKFVAIKPRNFTQVCSPFAQFHIWLIGLVSLVGWFPNTFLLNYGVNYLTDTFHISEHAADATVKLAFSCFALGAIIPGIFAGVLRKKRILIAGGYILAAITFSMAVYYPGLTITSAATLIFFTAFFTSVAIVCYAKAYDYCREGQTGITFGLVACITTIGNTLMARLISYLLGKSASAIPTTSTWHWILALIPLALILGAFIALTLRKPATMNM